MIAPAPSIEHLRGALGIREVWDPLPDRAGTPWFVRVALGAIAWLGGTFLLAFVSWFVGVEGALPVGLALFAAGVALRHVEPRFLRDFWLQASLLAMVGARGAIGLGVSDLVGEQAAFFALFALECATVVLYPGRAPRVVAVFCALSWLAAAFETPWVTELLAVGALAIAAVLSEAEAEARQGALAPFWEPVVVACALWSLAGLAGASPDWEGSHPWIASLGVAAVGAVVAARWLDEARAAPLTSLAAGAGALALGAIGASVPGTLAGLVCAALAFRRRSPLWLAASLAGVCGHAIYLYWQMHGSFAAKGAAMIGLGLVLFAVAALAHRRES